MHLITVYVGTRIILSLITIFLNFLGPPPGVMPLGGPRGPPPPRFGGPPRGPPPVRNIMII